MQALSPYSFRDTRRVPSKYDVQRGQDECVSEMERKRDREREVTEGIVLKKKKEITPHLSFDDAFPCRM